MSDELYKPSLSENVAVKALSDIESKAYEHFWEERREFGNYEDAALSAIRCAIRATADLMEPTPTDTKEHIKLADLYWKQVHS